MPELIHKPITGLYDPRIPDGGDMIQWEFYHRVRLAAAAATQTVRFFVNTAGLSLVATNWAFGNDSRFSSGNGFAVMGVGFEFANHQDDQSGAVAGMVTTLNAVEFLNGGTFRFAVERKDYLVLPVSKLIAGVGLYVEPQRTTLANAVAFHTEIGKPHPRALYTLAPGVWIGPNYMFEATLTVNGALTTSLDVRLYFSGWWDRNVQ